jgi:hypothetical protein
MFSHRLYAARFIELCRRIISPALLAPGKIANDPNSALRRAYLAALAIIHHGTGALALVSPLKRAQFQLLIATQP